MLRGSARPLRDCATLVIRCLESGLYAAIVALSIILVDLVLRSGSTPPAREPSPAWHNPREGQKLRKKGDRSAIGALKPLPARSRRISSIGRFVGFD